MGRMTDSFGRLNRELFLLGDNLERVTKFAKNLSDLRFDGIHFGDTETQMEGESVEAFLARRRNAARQAGFEGEGGVRRAGSARTAGNNVPFRSDDRRRGPAQPFANIYPGLNTGRAGGTRVNPAFTRDDNTAGAVDRLHDTVKRRGGAI